MGRRPTIRGDVSPVSVNAYQTGSGGENRFDGNHTGFREPVFPAVGVVDDHRFLMEPPSDSVARGFADNPQIFLSRGSFGGIGDVFHGYPRFGGVYNGPGRIPRPSNQPANRRIDIPGDVGKGSVGPNTSNRTGDVQGYGFPCSDRCFVGYPMPGDGSGIEMNDEPIPGHSRAEPIFDPTGDIREDSTGIYPNRCVAENTSDEIR